MMNPNTHGGGHIYHGRRPQEVQYHPQPHYPPNVYYHPQQVPQPFHHQTPQQWSYYNMQAPMSRPYHQPYPSMMTNHYPIPQPPSISPRPNPPQQVPSSASIRSHQNMPSPSPITERPTPKSQHDVPLNRPSSPPTPAYGIRRVHFQPPLPWYSVPEAEYPKRKSRRRPHIAARSPTGRVELPSKPSALETSQTSGFPEKQSSSYLSPKAEQNETTTSGESRLETPVIPSILSEPSVHHLVTTSHLSSAAVDNTQRAKKSIPIVPAVPNLPLAPRSGKKVNEVAISEATKSNGSISNQESDAAVVSGSKLLNEKSTAFSSDDSRRTSIQERHAPKSWADLVRSQTSNDTTTSTTANGQKFLGNSSLPNSAGESRADFFSSFSVRKSDSGNKIAFLKPRGIINTGNMCYMNSILQVLVYCIPFYDFLDQARKQAAYSFKSETPMIDAMIEFVREFSVIDSASSPEQLNMRLKDTELEEYGDAFIPEFVYEVIRRLPRFSSMRRGHQQDAEEFLGFLLEEMHEECLKIINGLPSKLDGSKATDPSPSISEEGGWHEVGPKQKASITRSAGFVEAESPINKIFGGKLRSELRVPGAKTSVTLEPYQPLQLDIGSAQITNITEALKGLTRSETLHGDFNSPRGPGVNATKQVFVESLPPVLILHLKRFQYDNTGGTQKIWKKVGYPLELEIPKEVFPAHKRGSILAHGGLPKYRLIGVVYHHGKNASGGHYTVDIRRQNDREWVRIDDTIIRRIKSEDVAEAGTEEDPKVIGTTIEQHRRDDGTISNIFDVVRDDNESGSQPDKGWSQVNGAANQVPRKWSGVVNGATTPTSSSGRMTPVGRTPARDSKVAYILFYQKLGY